MPKRSILASFWEPKACCHIVFPDRSVLIGQKLVGNAKIQKFKCEVLRNYQTMWEYLITVDHLIKYKHIWWKAPFHMAWKYGQFDDVKLMANNQLPKRILVSIWIEWLLLIWLCKVDN